MSLVHPTEFPTVDVIHDTAVHDPYRWLEDPTRPATREWIQQQQRECTSYFDGYSGMGRLRTRVESLLDVEAVDQPCIVNSRYFFRQRDKRREQACIYFRDGVTGTDRLLVDPSTEGSFAAAEIYRVSDDGVLLAYGLARGGGDRREIHIIDTEAGTDKSRALPEGYRRGFAFAPNNQGFYCVHETNSAGADYAVRYCSLSGNASDRVVFSRPRSPGSSLTLISDDLHLGAIWVEMRGARRECDFFIASYASEMVWRPIFQNKLVPHAPFLHSGRIFVLTYESKGNGELVELLGDGQGLRVILPERDSPPRQIAFAGRTVLATYYSSAGSILESRTIEGDRLSAPMISEGTIRLLPQMMNSARSVFSTYETFIQPPSVFEYCSETDKTSLWHKPEYLSASGIFSVRASSFPSIDGVDIPISIVSSPQSSVFTRTPLIMTTYGGFGVPTTPRFSALETVMLELGATLAIPHIRGGGEHGKAWHEAGRGIRRQTSIDDFLSAAEWLCHEGLTSPKELAIFGGSHSGLLVGAAVTQRPELFRAGLCIAPLLDMVRYEIFDRAARWRSEYGTTADPDEFYALYGYSPYHRVRDGVNYPAMLFVTGDQDDRCNPAHVRKMAARLKERACQSNPILVDYSSERGHSPTLPLSVRIDALTRRIAFLCRELNIEVSYEVSDGAANL
jgi:prolyl oligopeptidase